MNRKATGNEGKMELQMTSMIDVVFLLLIFFVVTLRIPPEEGLVEAAVAPAPVKPQEKDLPTATAGSEFNGIVVRLGYDGRRRRPLLACDDIPMADFAALRARLGSLRVYSADVQVAVDCGDDVPYEHVMRALDTIRDADYGRIVFLNVR